ncbi:hypothetical protein ACIBCM_31535 [Streptomyces sp. NPDC051018]|uniref:hypothetical protein n=1 Tax=Streptomyces sp. NPDC051018 TaxID=3365639 RepID=UPI00378A15CF
MIPLVALVAVAERPSGPDSAVLPVPASFPVPELPLVPLLLVVFGVMGVVAATGLLSPRAGTEARMRTRSPDHTVSAGLRPDGSTTGVSPSDGSATDATELTAGTDATDVTDATAGSVTTGTPDAMTTVPLATPLETRR